DESTAASPGAAEPALDSPDPAGGGAEPAPVEVPADSAAQVGVVVQDRAAALREAVEATVDPNAYRIQLPTFEGPLDLLLHLIQQHELDILDIPIGFIAQKYNEYLRLMTNL